MNHRVRIPDKAWISHLSGLAILWIWILGNYHETAESMVGTWARSETFAHGFLVFPIVMWLIWRKRQSLFAMPPAFSWLGVAFMALSVLLWMVGDAVNANVIRDFALIFMLNAGAWALLGFSVVRIIAFPLFFMLFAVPFGEFLIPVFMKWTADFTVIALRITGIPVHQEGMRFIIPSGSWSVIEACSGVRYLISSLSIGSLFAYLSFNSWWRRSLFILFSLLVPIVANWFRAYFIVLLGHLSSNRLAAGVDHIIYGWVFFGVVITILFFCGAKWSEQPIDSVSRSVDGKAFDLDRNGLIAGMAVAVLVISMRFLI